VVDAPSGVRLIVDDQKPQELIEVVQGKEFALNDHSFWQIHHQAAEILHGAVSRAVIRELLVPDAPNADLYSGVGLLGHALSSLSTDTLTLSAVESEVSALNYLERNLSQETNLTAVADRVDRWLSHQVRTLTAEEKEKWTRATILLDPPRSGAKAEVIDSLTRLSPAQIVYVACDPVALGRDAGLLQKAGYDMVFIEAWDLFPHTHHLETIATFVKT
jgi:tRNA/tmRNA/rRNA uracil-C5-methylase (TrmA/RlmC/RlmD family)